MNRSIKALLIISLVALLAIGGFSLYKILSGRKEDLSKSPVAVVKEAPIAITDPAPTVVLPKPTDAQRAEVETAPVAATYPLDPSPTPTVSLTSNTPTPIKFVPYPSIKPTNTPTPTLKPKATYTPTPIEKTEELPVAGISFPTIIIFSIGILLLLPAILI